MYKKKVIIIGGGISGLASACLLAKKGFEVVLFEKNKTLGGRARVMKKKDFQFDMGPSWYMMPEVFDRFFFKMGHRISDYYQLIRLDPRYKVIFEDGSNWILDDNIDKNKKIFEKEESGAGVMLEAYLRKSKETYEASSELMYADVWSFKTWLNFENIKNVIRLCLLLPFWSSWYWWVGRFFKSEKIKKILCFPSVFLGGSPFDTPSLYSILSWADFGKGIWYPKGGMIKVVEALEKMAIENGVQINTNSSVEKIVVKNGVAQGVKVKGVFYPSDYVIAGGDMANTEINLLPAKYQTYSRKYWDKKKMSISALMIYVGLNRRVPQDVHHLLYFSDDWRKNFEELGMGQLPKDPSLYISLRSVTDRTIVPKDKDEIVILVPLGANCEYPDKDLEEYTKKILEKTEKIIGQKILDKLEVVETFTPKNFALDYDAYKGSALGLAHTLGQSLWFRPDNRSKKVDNLFYVGQYTNPGVGVPMALISAEMVERMINE